MTYGLGIMHGLSAGFFICGLIVLIYRIKTGRWIK